MARSDMVGFFWNDTPAPKPPKAEKAKPVPPEPVWLRPDYLPGLEEALRFPVQKFTDGELVQAAIAKEELVFDIECYENYFLAAFKSCTSAKVIYFEMTPTHPLNAQKLKWVFDNFKIITFNGIKYDMPIAALAVAGKSNSQLKAATNEIILMDARPSDVLRSAKVKALKVNHIDLIEVAPLFASLKIYGGRLHTRKMQDLPFHPDILLNSNQMAITRWYCVNDLDNTYALRMSLSEQIMLRENMSVEYKMDLRSKSDAQLAEAVISEEIEAINGRRVQRPTIAPGTVYYYNRPAFIKFETERMNWALDLVCKTPFVVSDEGNIGMPPALKELQIPIADGIYRMGIGGLHSSEHKRAIVLGEDEELCDIDMTSYYPYIILNQGLYPKHLGPSFLRVYKSLVDKRITAKRAGDKVTADSLKITINGAYGKLGSQYSVLYAPDLLIQVTLTGQLALLMLIELLELRGFTVVNGNTDGIVVHYKKSQKPLLEQIVKYFEAVSQFGTEETKYRALYSRDVNNYIAVYREPIKNKDGSFTYAKLKGAYGKTGLSKNPTNQICVDAVINLVVHGIPLAKTVAECKDIRRFVSVRTVKTGAVKDGQFLGKSIRWYYALNSPSFIVVAKNGYAVPKTQGAKPLMELPDAFPDDVDLEWYVKEADKMLEEIGYQ